MLENISALLASEWTADRWSGNHSRLLSPSYAMPKKHSQEKQDNFNGKQNKASAKNCNAKEQFLQQG